MRLAQFFFILLIFAGLNIESVYLIYGKTSPAVSFSGDSGESPENNTDAEDSEISEKELNQSINSYSKSLVSTDYTQTKFRFVFLKPTTPYIELWIRPPKSV